MSEWISVEERLPEPMIEVVLCFCNDIVSEWQETLYRNSTGWVQMTGDEFCPIVTHWQPLPEPPTP